MIGDTDESLIQTASVAEKDYGDYWRERDTHLIITYIKWERKGGSGTRRLHKKNQRYIS